MKIFNYEGNISRSEYWKRIGFYFFAAVLPFIIVLVLGETILKHSPLGFFLLYLFPLMVIYFIFLGISFFKTLNQRIRSVGHSFNRVFIIGTVVFFTVLFLFVYASYNGAYALYMGYLASLLSLLIIGTPLYYGIIKDKDSGNVVNL